MEWLEISDSTVESAKERALVHLGVHESDAEFEVISEGKVGLFGRVKEEARVRARVVPTTVRPKERSRGYSGRRSSSARRAETATSGDTKPAPQTSSRPSSRRRTRKKTEPAAAADNKKKDVKPMRNNQSQGPSLLEQADLAESFVQGIAESLGMALTFQRHDLEQGIMRIEAHGEDIGLLVGRRGMTAQAIDELVRTVLQRSGGSIREGKIRIDVGGVRARRAAALAEFTRKVADQAIETREDIALEPMNRMDRKIVHDAVSNIEQVESRSVGEDPHRRVIIAAVSS